MTLHAVTCGGYSYWYAGKTPSLGATLRTLVETTFNSDPVLALHCMSESLQAASVIIVTGSRYEQTLFCCRCMPAVTAVAKGAWLLDEAFISKSDEIKGIARLADYEIEDVRVSRKAGLCMGGPKKAREVRYSWAIRVN